MPLRAPLGTRIERVQEEQAQHLLVHARHDQEVHAEAPQPVAQRREVLGVDDDPGRLDRRRGAAGGVAALERSEHPGQGRRLGRAADHHVVGRLEVFGAGLAPHLVEPDLEPGQHAAHDVELAVVHDQRGAFRLHRPPLPRARGARGVFGRRSAPLEAAEAAGCWAGGGPGVVVAEGVGAAPP